MTNPIPSELLCPFVVAWRGRCNDKADETGLCEHHRAMKCSSCGAQATHDCDHTGQFVCGVPLCDGCHGVNDANKSPGTWGFMNHSHQRKKVTP